METWISERRVERDSLLGRAPGATALFRESHSDLRPVRPDAGAGKPRSPRHPRSVPIEVTGRDASGAPFIEHTVTTDISARGARIRLIHSLLPGDIVTVLNKKNGMEGEFCVIGAFEELSGERRDWGLEALDPAGDIWGGRSAGAVEESEPKALIECGGCHTKAYSPVSSLEYEVLVSIGTISRHCDRCGYTTQWRPSLPPLIDGKSAASDRPAGPQIENREAHRRSLTLRLRLRDAVGLVETVYTLDVSRTGLCFASRQRYAVGEEVSFTFPPSNSHQSFEIKGKIVGSGGVPGNWRYGVRLLVR